MYHGLKVRIKKKSLTANQKEFILRKDNFFPTCSEDNSGKMGAFELYTFMKGFFLIICFFS